MKKTLLHGFTPPHRLSGMAESTPILLALSGGADSSALLFLLAEYARQTGASLSVAHVDHKLRGEASDADREFCRTLAQTYGLPFYLLEADVAALASEHHRGIEEEARHVRYDFFASTMREHRIPLLATAHNADDNAETLLFHLARGSGLRGLCGIPPTRQFEGGKLIRPLLGATKSDILAFCQRNGIHYVTDKTNADVAYARNRLRHRVLPELTAVNSGALGNITRLCASLSRDEAYLTDSATAFMAQHGSGNAIALDALDQAHPAIATRVIASLLSQFTDDVRAVHIDAALSLAASGVPHSSVDLGDGVKALIEDGSLIFSNEQPPPPKHFCYSLHEGENLISEVDMLIVIEKSAPSHKNQQIIKNIYKKATTTRISFDKIYGSFIVEPRREGDVILSGGMHKKVKKLMCDRKLPLPLRNRLPLFRDSRGIVWIPSVALRDGAADGDNIMTVTLYYNA